MIKIGSNPHMHFKGKENNNKSNAINLINKDRLADSFIEMAKIDTGSDESQAEAKTPSTDKQWDLAKVLYKELKDNLKLEDVNIDKHSIVTATLPHNLDVKDSPVIGLLAHTDTSNSVPTGPVNPQVHQYKGGDIKLNDETTISASDLKGHEGEEIITSDGTTLLGADDKAGIAEILEALRVYKENPDLKHPTLRIAFTPDEETGMGTAKFDIKKFGADLAYTVDGEAPHSIETETFNAFNPEINIKGKNVHPGMAYGKMVSAEDIATDFKAAIPKNERPYTTKGKEGYYHVLSSKGDESNATIKMLVRDFDYDNAKKRVKFLQTLAEKVEKENPGSKITVTPNEKYHNMKEKLNEFPKVIEYAKNGIKRTGLTPEEESIRGGTDGANLTLEGLLTPNLGAGGVNFHSKEEFVSKQDMKTIAANIINIMSEYADNTEDIMPEIIKRRER